MKKIILLTAFAALVLGSCKKDSKSTTAANTFSATIDGTNETFANNISAMYTSETGASGQSLGITASRGTGAAEEILQVAIYSGTTVAKGTYTIASSGNSATNYPLIAYYQNVLSSNPLTYGTDISGANVTTVTITSLTSTNVQGTFNAVLLPESGSGTNQTVTNGKFNVNITAK